MVRTGLSYLPRSLSPWEVLDRRVKSLFGDLMSEEGDAASPTAFVPRTNLAETEDHYEVTMDLPGLKAEDVQIEFQNDTLTVFGEQQEVKEEKGKKFHRVERTSGKFYRSISLPDTVDPDKVSADFKEGVLTITMPKSEAVKPKQIKIKS